MDNPIGIFDSGIGGISVLKELINHLPNEQFVYMADSKNAPYGVLSENEITKLSEKNINFLISKNVKLIVIACNTATAASVYKLREKYKLPIVGLEPAIKPACLKTKTANIAVLATEGTFRGDHFKNTSRKYQKYVKIHLRVAKDLVEIAENAMFNSEQAKNALNEHLKYFEDKNIDHIVLGCTHYPFFSNIINDYYKGKVNIIDSSEAVARRTKDVLMTNNILNKNNNQNTQTLYFYTNKNLKVLSEVVQKHLNVTVKQFEVEKINI